MADRAEISFHKGQTLLHLANNYPTMVDVIMELVQNAIDVDVKATRVWIKINHKTGRLSVSDNGMGISQSEFNRRLATVAEYGRKQAGSMGKFALGLMSPLGKCERWTFVSCAHPQTALFYEWTFVTKDITSSAKEQSVPLRVRQDLTLDKNARGKNTVEWRSRVEMSGFVTEKQNPQIGRMPTDEIRSRIQQQYSKVMRQNNVTVSLEIIDEKGGRNVCPDIRAREFIGEKLSVVEGDWKDAGKVRFEMYVAPRRPPKDYKAQINVGVIGDPFQIPFHLFVLSATRSNTTKGLVDEEVLEALDALSKGFFEGNITAERITLRADRKAFAPDNALTELLLAVSEWYRDHGRELMEQAKNERQEERFQELGRKSLKVLEGLLQTNPRWKDTIKSFKLGTVGAGHIKLRGTQTGDQTEGNMLSVDEPVKRKPHSEGGEDGGEGNPQKEKPDHIPVTVSGQRGQRRKIVRGHSMGLGISHEFMEGAELWVMDKDLCIVRLNIRHPLFRECDKKGDRAFMAFQENVVMQAITVQTLPEPMREQSIKAFNEYNEAFVHWVISGDRLRGKGSGRKDSTQGEE